MILIAIIGGMSIGLFLGWGLTKDKSKKG